MPYEFTESRRHKFAKARYRVTNWPEYDAAWRWCTWRIEGEMTPAPGGYAMMRWQRTDFGRSVASMARTNETAFWYA